jgi:D-alanyl-D-alanine carboxypeptidase
MRATRFQLACGLSLLIALGSCAGTAPMPIGHASLPPANDLLGVAEAGRQELGSPGLAVVVLRGDEVLVAEGLGQASIERGDAVTAATRFMLNSITKQLVAAATLRLAERGDLALEDPVSHHLPEFTHLPAELRIHHLLSHTSGMREELVQPELAALWKRPETTIAEYEAAMKHAPADFVPGTRWSYSNINYAMLTMIVERRTGKALETALHDLVLAPIGLAPLRLCPQWPGEAAGEAMGYVPAEGGLRRYPPENVPLFRGAGGFCGTALDVARWTRALAKGRVVSADSYRRMTTPVRLADGREADYGYAMSLVRPDGVPRSGHGGYGAGFAAQAAYYPEAELTVVVMANRFTLAEKLERKLARRLLGLREPAVVELPLAAEQRARFVGEYDVGIHGMPVSVVERDDRLWFEWPAPPLRFPLVAVGDGDFLAQGDPDHFRLTFHGDELALRGMGLMTWYGVRKAAEP